MTEKESPFIARPSGLMRLLLRFPVYLYRLHLGWLLGSRFLLLIHTGRKSGKLRQTVLEVVRYDSTTDTYIVASGYGEKSDWFRNIKKSPEVEIRTGFRHFPALATQLQTDEAKQELRDYARRHPFAFRQIATKLLSISQIETDEDFQRAAESIPIIRFRPVSNQSQPKSVS